MGAVTPASRTRRTISSTAAADSRVLTVTRTSSEPASASAITCAAVETGSAVSVFVIDWTTTGCPPPTGTPPTRHTTLGRRAFERSASIWIRGIALRLPERGGPHLAVERVAEFHDEAGQRLDVGLRRTEVHDARADQERAAHDGVRGIRLAARLDARQQLGVQRVEIFVDRRRAGLQAVRHVAERRDAQALRERLELRVRGDALVQ